MKNTTRRDSNESVANFQFTTFVRSKHHTVQQTISERCIEKHWHQKISTGSQHSTITFLLVIPGNTHLKSVILSLTECAGEFQTDALLDTRSYGMIHHHSQRHNHVLHRPDRE